VAEYIVQAGPLRTFETLFDPRSGKTKAVADYHTIELVSRDRSRPGVLAELRRSADQEIRFLESFLRATRTGHRLFFGMRDANQGRAWMLSQRLKGRDGTPWSLMKYGVSEDDLLLLEVREFDADFRLIREFAPPLAGEMFFTLTRSTFDLYDIGWQRAARSSSRPGEDRFRRDVAALAYQSLATLLQDGTGSFTLILDPSAVDVPGMERQITSAGKQAGMEITFAPSLFG
jgi:hypothetical protein